MWIPASFKLVVLCCFWVLPALPCFASYVDLFNIILAWAYCHVLVLYFCASYLAMYCIIYRIVLHHTFLSILSCSCVVCLPYYLLLLVSACSVAIVRIRSSTRGSSSRLLLRLLHGSVLLPCGISGKMTIPLDTFTIIAMLSVSMLSLYVALPIIYCQPLSLLPWNL